MHLIIENILNVLLCRTCPMCGKVTGCEEKGLCAECAREVRYIEEPYCIKCGEPLSSENEMYCRNCYLKTHYFDRAFGIFEHTGIAKKSIYDYKFKNVRVNARFYAQQAVRIHKMFFDNTKIDGIVPVPVHKSREQEQGYNQAYIFAKELSKITGIPCYDKVLIKKEKTKSQKKLSESMRYINLKKAFAVDAKVAGKLKQVLIVDDIYTTGSTADACSELLKKAGTSRAFVLCISRGVNIGGKPEEITD